MIAYLRCVVEFMNTKEGLRETAKLSIVPALFLFLGITGHPLQLLMYKRIPAMIVAEAFLFMGVFFLIYTSIFLVHHVLFFYYQAQDEKNPE